MSPMKYQTIYILAIITIFLSSCSQDENYSASYSNDIDVSQAWLDSKIPSVEKSLTAHSGIYLCKIDSSKPYSATFNLKVEDISNKPFNKVKLSAWIKAGSQDAKPQFVIDIIDPNTKSSIEWINKPFSGIDLKIDNEWNLYEFELSLSEKNRLTKTNEYRIYVCNFSKTPVLVDDLKVDFY
jgi:hypothetical protein